MNGDGPLISFDPGADRVSYAPVLHGVSLDQTRRSGNAKSAGEAEHRCW